MTHDQISAVYNEMLITGIAPNQASDTLLSLQEAGLL